MTKISLDAGNAFCPQALYLYGTYRDDGRPNYGLFCWCTYCAVGDELKFVACIGEDKLTRDLIRKNGIFSATAVTEELLAAADYCGMHSGVEFDKSSMFPSTKGQKLDVPVPEKGMWTFELQVERTLIAGEDSDIYICGIKNVLADSCLADTALTFEQKVELVKPVVTMDHKYLSIAPGSLGNWGEVR